MIAKQTREKREKKKTNKFQKFNFVDFLNSRVLFLRVAVKRHFFREAGRRATNSFYSADDVSS
tara:strand:+ start:1993 stop:2181 length:189 start_codon:yes stop_codon:yes gene_type:complete